MSISPLAGGVLDRLTMIGRDLGVIEKDGHAKHPVSYWLNHFEDHYGIQTTPKEMVGHRLNRIEAIHWLATRQADPEIY